LAQPHRRRGDGPPRTAARRHRRRTPRRALRAVRPRPQEEGTHLLQGQPAEGRAGRRAGLQLLLLDEPTAGLDPLMEAVFQECIREARAAGRTVLLSSHVLAQVEALADRISIIRDGRIVESGSLQELRHLTRTTVTVLTGRPTDGLAALPGIHDVR